MDLTTSLMGFCVRTQMLAWDLCDGDDAKAGKVLSDIPKINLYRKDRALLRQFSFFEYMCYQFFFIHVLAGSTLGGAEYQHIIDRTVFERVSKQLLFKPPTQDFFVFFFP